MKAYHLNEQAHATVLAALRYYQHQGLADDPALRPDVIHEIATGGNERLTSLDGEAIDQLCERLNFGGANAAAALQLACCRAEAEMARWPEKELDSPEHRALRRALGQYQQAIDALG